MMEGLKAMPPGLASFQRGALVAGVIGAVTCVGGAFVSPGQFFRSYLIAYLFWFGIAVGSLAIVMLWHLSGGAWGLVIRRLLESGTRTLPLLALLFVPLLVGLRDLYVWTRPEAVAADELLQHKSPYLNVPFFVIRAAFYFAVWSTLAYFLNRWSRQQDDTGDVRLARKMQALSGPGLVLFVLTMTFAGFDWVMSLEPHWFSTIFGALFMVGHVLAAFSFVIATVILLARKPPLAGVVSPAHLHDLGKLLLAIIMLWAYFAFSQFLIIWAGNLPEEIPWYLRRLQGGWQWIGLALVVLHFALPFVLLLSRGLKRDSTLLSRVSLLVILMRVADLYWMVAPAFSEDGAWPRWLDPVAFVAVGGIWLAAFASYVRRWPLLPIRDPALQEAMVHEKR